MDPNFYIFSSDSMLLSDEDNQTNSSVDIESEVSSPNDPGGFKRVIDKDLGCEFPVMLRLTLCPLVCVQVLFGV